MDGLGFFKSHLSAAQSPPSQPSRVGKHPLSDQAPRLGAVSQRSSPLDQNDGMEMDSAEEDSAGQLVTSDVDPGRKRRGPVPYYGVKSLADFEIAIQSHHVAAAIPTPTAARVVSSSGGGGMVVKKRGRPKGWKPGMPYSTTSARPVSEAAKQLRAQQLKDDPNAIIKLKGRPGRPPKKPALTARQIFRGLNPEYYPFICEWKGCKAELQNMETLRRHVHKIHGKNEACSWGKCGKVSPGSPDGKENHHHQPLRTRLEFATDDEMAAHIEKAHLIPFEWHMGDGFLNDGISGDGGGLRGDTAHQADTLGTEAPAYLFDKNGNQVTPWVRDQQVEDHATMVARRRQLRMTLEQMNADAPSEDSDPEEEDVQ